MSLSVTTIAWTRFRQSTFPCLQANSRTMKNHHWQVQVHFCFIPADSGFSLLGLTFLYTSCPCVYASRRPLKHYRFSLSRVKILAKAPPPPLIFLTTLILIGPNPLSNYFLKLTFLTAAILMLFSSFSSSILFLIILSELSWLLFFCFTHAVLKAFAIQAALLIFIFFLAIATPTKVLDSPGNSLTNYNPGSF